MSEAQLLGENTIRESPAVISPKAELLACMGWTQAAFAVTV